MTSFLEMRSVTKTFGSGPGATRAVSDFSYAVDESTPIDHRRRGRIR